MKRITDEQELEHAIERLKQTIWQERKAYLELHRAKRQQLDELQAVLRELLETEAAYYRRKDLA